MAAITISPEDNLLVETPPMSPEYITFDEGHLISPEHIVIDDDDGEHNGDGDGDGQHDEDQTNSSERVVSERTRSISPEHIALVQDRIVEIISKQISEYTFDFKQPFINQIYYKYNFEKIFQIESDPLVKIIGSAIVENDKSMLNTF